MSHWPLLHNESKYARAEVRLDSIQLHEYFLYGGVLYMVEEVVGKSYAVDDDAYEYLLFCIDMEGRRVDVCDLCEELVWVVLVG